MIMKTHRLHHTALLFIALSFVATSFFACGKDSTDPPATPTEKPKEKEPEKPKEGDDDEELCETNYNITKIIFPVNMNATLGNDVTIYPDENNLFRARVYGKHSYDGKRYWMPANTHKLYVNIESDAKAIYINGVEYKKGSQYDFSEETTLTAYSDTGAEKSYTVILEIGRAHV